MNAFEASRMRIRYRMYQILFYAFYFYLTPGSRTLQVVDKISYLILHKPVASSKVPYYNNFSNAKATKLKLQKYFAMESKEMIFCGTKWQTYRNHSVNLRSKIILVHFPLSIGSSFLMTLAKDCCMILYSCEN